MSCCSGDMAASAVMSNMSDEAKENELSGFAITLPNGGKVFVLSSPSIHCGGCISILEKELSVLAGVVNVRVNLTLKRVRIELINQTVALLPIVEKMRSLGFDAVPIDLVDDQDILGKSQNSTLLRALAVAGFGAMNIMLLSVSTWSGAEGSAKTLFHLISALIAIPTVLYSGQVFFRSAFKALRHGHLNMDVPISLAVLLALSMSIFEALTHGDIVYFDASVSLLFFLLIGRYLDQMMRDRARNAVSTLARQSVKGASQVMDNGQVSYLPIDEVQIGMILRILPGEKIPVDGIVVKGASDLDASLVTGESLPTAIKIDTPVLAGTLNLSGVVDIKVSKAANQSFLAEITNMLDAAENGRGAYVRIADRMAQIYAPAVHLLALAGFVLWMFYTGGDWRVSIYIAISILIITCPCALGLAVPVVHVIGAGRLFDQGILMKDGAALERLSEVDHVVFDKTGTLTSDQLTISHVDITDAKQVALLKALALHSSHPVSRAIAQHFKQDVHLDIDGVREMPGYGIEAKYEGTLMRLGSASWVGDISSHPHQKDTYTRTFFAIEGQMPIGLIVQAEMRVDALTTLEGLAKFGLPVEILSGDNKRTVKAFARAIGVESFMGEAKPQDKIDRINLLTASGAKVLMVGDGINDAPSLAAGHASMAPASASDVGRSAADFVFTRNNLSAILFAMKIAKKSNRLVRQNFALALLYNMIAVPMAFSGIVTPLIAAIAMSASSIIVILNSMRLAKFGQKPSAPIKATKAIKALA